MIKGILKWEEVIIREIEPKELADVIEKLVSEVTTDVTVATEINGTFSVSYTKLIEPWKEV